MQYIENNRLVPLMEKVYLARRRNLLGDLLSRHDNGDGRMDGRPQQSKSIIAPLPTFCGGGMKKKSQLRSRGLLTEIKYLSDHLFSGSKMG